MFKEQSAQVFTIHAFTSNEHGRKQFPMVYALMSKRRTEDYVALFEAVKEYSTRIGLACNPKSFMVDFEAGKYLAAYFFYNCQCQNDE